MTERTKLGSYDWAQVSQKSADRARTDRKTCESIQQTIETRIKDAEQFASTAEQILVAVQNTIPVEVRDV